MICTRKMGRINWSAYGRSFGNGRTQPVSVIKKIKNEPAHAIKYDNIGSALNKSDRAQGMYNAR